MASVQQKNETFYCQFSFGGKRHTITVGKVRRSQAEAFADNVETLLEQVRRGRLAIPDGVSVTEFVLSDGKAQPVAETVQKTLTVGDLLARYLTAVGGGALEKSTVYTLTIHSNHLKRLLGERTPTSSLNRDSMQGYVTRRSAEKYHGKTIHPDTPKKEITTLRTAWNWAVIGDLLVAPFPGVKLQYAKKEEQPGFMTWAEIERRIGKGGDADELWPCLYLTKPEMDELLAFVKDHGSRPWVYPLVFLVAHTGARRSEVLRATLGDLDLAGGVMEVRERKRVKGQKTTRRVPLSPPLRTVLVDWLEVHPGSTHLFAQPGKPPSPISRNELVHHFGTTVEGSKWEILRGLHILRHSFISLCASRGMDQRLIDEFVGHCSEEQRRRYRHLYPDVQRKAIDDIFRV